MRILVTGKNGQLGRSIAKEIKANAAINNEFIFVGRNELNLNSLSDIEYYFNSNDRFDFIINCAAYTAVDLSEEGGLANQVNNTAVKKLAQIANSQKATLVHISTDYVFSGEDNRPYTEADYPNPINTYGKSKRAGEKAIQEIMVKNATIIRTSWLYSEYGNNFVKTMIALGQQKKEINVVSDQRGSPTYATDLANVILKLIDIKIYESNEYVTEIYHFSNKGEISWCDFAKEIFKIKNIDCQINPVLTNQYSSLARRPKNTVMSKEKISTDLNIEVVCWKESLNKLLIMLR